MGRMATFAKAHLLVGTISFPSGQTHINNFDEGELINGTISFPDGQMQRGTFVDGKLQGEGVLVSFNHQRREGHFKDGFLHGQGKVACPNGDFRKAYTLAAATEKVSSFAPMECPLKAHSIKRAISLVRVR
jgi:hypothetical protein